MLTTVIRKEHKNDWEKRTALIPSDAAELVEKGFPISIEPSEIRIYPDSDYQQANIPLNGCPEKGQFIVGIKEPPVKSIQPHQVHLAFSHTMKGQDYNMDLLQKFIDQQATLIDYEPIVDNNGKRKIAFGRFAGIAGAVDSFHIAGKKFAAKKLASSLENVRQTWQYTSIEEIKESFSAIDLTQGEPLQVVIVGTGNVGKGSQEVCQWLGLPEISAEELLSGKRPEGNWYAMVSSRHINRHKNNKAFDMQEFIKQGAASYESTFDQLLGKFDILLQTPYWTVKYPKHLTKERMQANLDKLPLVIGDISCDINGSLECTTQITDIDTPAITYCAKKDETIDGVIADGVTVVSIDNLPCELSLDASNHFSNILKNYLPDIMNIDLSQPLEKSGLDPDLAKGVIVYNGKLTANFHYLQTYLDEYNSKVNS